MASSVNRSPSRSRSPPRRGTPNDDWSDRPFAPVNDAPEFLDFVRPQPALIQLGGHIGSELYLRSCLRRTSLGIYWRLRSRMVRSGGCHDELLFQWVRQDVPSDTTRTINGLRVALADFDVVADERAEAAFWVQWGQGIWAGILVSEMDLLREAGHDARFDVAHFRRERELGIPPSPYGFLPCSIFVD